MISCPPSAANFPALVSHRWIGLPHASGCRKTSASRHSSAWVTSVLRMGLSAGVALAAKGRYAPKFDPELIGLSMLNKEEEGEDRDSRRPRDVEEADESWAFWEEQKNPTPGPGNAPREKIPNELPVPMPSLEPPEKDGDDVMDQETRFKKAYGKDATIMGTDGEPLKVPQYSSFKEAVEEFEYPNFLQAALVRRGFFYLTPVQQCSLPLLQGGHDFMATSFTGSGKTTAYLLPILKSLHQAARLVPGIQVASHYKIKDGQRSARPSIATVRGMKKGQAALEFEEATGKSHRQLVPVDWVVGAPEPPLRRRWEGPALPGAIVLVPTRELCEQVHLETKEFLYYSALRSVALFGDSNLRSQFRDLAHGADILVSTPGRLVDALHKGLVRLDKVRYLVLDEVDRMMELGFGSQLEEIVTQGAMPSKGGGRQTTFWSATIPLSVRELAEAFLGRNCVWVDCTGGQTNPVPTTISHVFVDARPPHRIMREFKAGDAVITKGGRRGIAEFQVGSRWRVQFDDGELIQRKMLKKGRLHHTSLRTDGAKLHKFELLREILETRDFEKATIIVFCRRRDTVMEVFRYLKEHFLGVVTCHGGMTQSFRSKSIKALKEGSAEILVATDIAARGLDIPDISHVVNFELPLVLDEFVHRCGRTGRIGRSGTSVTLVTGREKIFAAMRRMVLSQGHEIPEWMSLQGLQLAWCPRNYKIPFNKRRRGIPKDAAPETREAYIVKNRDMQRSTKVNLMTRMMELESTPLNPREMNRGTFSLLNANDEFFDERYEMAEDGNYQVTRDTRGGYEEVDLEELENYQEYPDGEDIQYSEDGEDELDDESFVGEEQMRA